MVFKHAFVIILTVIAACEVHHTLCIHGMSLKGKSGLTKIKVSTNICKNTITMFQDTSRCSILAAPDPDKIVCKSKYPQPIANPYFYHLYQSRVKNQF